MRHHHSRQPAHVSEHLDWQDEFHCWVRRQLHWRADSWDLLWYQLLAPFGSHVGPSPILRNSRNAHSGLRKFHFIPGYERFAGDYVVSPRLSSLSSGDVLAGSYDELDYEVLAHRTVPSTRFRLTLMRAISAGPSDTQKSQATAPGRAFLQHFVQQARAYGNLLP